MNNSIVLKVSLLLLIPSMGALATLVVYRPRPDIAVNQGSFHMLIIIASIDLLLLLFGFLAIKRYVNRRDLTTEKLAHNEIRYRAIVASAADAIITIDAQGHILSINPAVEKMFGYAAAELCGQKVNILMQPKERREHDSYLLHYRETGKGNIIGKGMRELDAQCRDGSTIPIELSVNEMHVEHQSLQFIGVIRDISRRKTYETTIRESQERFELITRGTSDGIWDWNLKTGQIYFSLRWKQMLGYDEAAIADDFMTLQNLIHPDDLGMALEYWISCLEGGSDHFTIEYRLASKTGDYRWIECKGLAQHDENGDPVRMAGSHSDITQRKQALTDLEQMTTGLQDKASELERINRELDQFAYITSHDLKAPLRAIANLSTWIEEDLDEVMTDDTRKQMQLLRGRVVRMEALINGILQYSRVGRVSMELEEVDIAQLLDEVLDDLAPPPDFKIKIGPGMPTLETARVPLSQVFANLLSNAIKYHDRADGCVIVSVSEVTSTELDVIDDTLSEQVENDAATCYEFRVSDDGPGIAPEYHKKVFQLFQTLQARDKVESTGVGLTLVKKIVQELGGQIQIESDNGQGAVFRFTLPSGHKEEMKLKNVG